jgi:hypothetical protein
LALPRFRLSHAAASAFSLALPLAATLAPCDASSQDVLTYHNDTYRTGWFSSETTLTPANVNPGSFGLLTTVTLDGRVDAEPLVAFGQPIDGQGTHDVVYVATEGDTVFALDAESGATLWSRNFGTPVPYQYKDGDDNVYPVMGILSTPAIDRTRGVLYVVADTYVSGGDIFTLHAIALNNGSDAVTPQTITATERLQNGSTWTLQPQHQLQRPALLEANNSIYLGFGSTGDTQPQISRGTMLRYDAATLAPLDAILTDTSVENLFSPFYLSSIWQSGFGPASDERGDVYFSTGNSNWQTPSYEKHVNYPDSVLRVTPDLSRLLQSFTPSDYFSLDQGDVDLGSGGTLVVPPLNGQNAHFVVAGGKDGRVWLLDADKMGGYHAHQDRVLDVESMGSCWCGPAYYVGPGGLPFVVTGGGNGVTTWQVQTSPPKLIQTGSTGSSNVNGLPDYGGTLPVVSSNGTKAGTAVVWYVQRPATSEDYNPGTPLTLWAYDPTNLGTPLFSAQAGTWTHAVNSNADLVPTVAGGRVYVASNEQLQIFGLLSEKARHDGVRR